MIRFATGAGAGAAEADADAAEADAGAAGADAEDTPFLIGAALLVGGIGATGSPRTFACCTRSRGISVELRALCVVLGTGM